MSLQAPMKSGRSNLIFKRIQASDKNSSSSGGRLLRRPVFGGTPRKDIKESMLVGELEFPNRRFGAGNPIPAPTKKDFRRSGTLTQLLLTTNLESTLNST
ncbi:MAG: hypothetical protein AMJ90_00540 [candidate division Zixibacteria bacterium SM23_73_2]|nr:MAG: hypothetical protein AMJ90_00540 [candidate division Zixibacteria bacterium SM23_73_2]